MDDKQEVFDVAIVGAGATGLATACAIRREAGAFLKVALVAPTRQALGAPLRTVALSPGSRALLERLGAWTRIEPKAQAILNMAIYDGRVGDAGRQEQMRFAAGAEPLAHMAYDDDVAAALEAAAQDAGVARLAQTAIGFEAGPFVATLRLDDGGDIRARLVIAADGAASKLRALAGIGVAGWPARQAGVVATLAHTRDHEGRAEQHFLPAGPFAMLPLRGRFSSIVWNETPEEAERLCAAPEAKFLEELERRFPPRLGDLSLDSARVAFPLRFQFARDYVADRLALVGDAAHLVHPLAGQGLNLGLRDAAALAEVVAAEARLGLDPGAARALAEYARRRRFDNLASGLGMDALNRLFSNDSALLRSLRDLGLRLVDRSAPLKRRLVAEAAGDGPDASRLLRGRGV